MTVASRSGASWDEYLFKGTAGFYERGRLPYADALGITLRDELGLDGRGTVADLGSGPGTLTRVLAGYVERVVAVDPDPDMIASGRALCNAANITWRTAAAEDVTFVPGELEAALFGQSFHWMDRERVAAMLREALRPGGHLVLVADVKTPRTGQPEGTVPVPHAEMDALIAEYLGSQRRAGRSVLASGTPRDEEEVLTRAGFTGPKRVVVPATRVLVRSVDDVMAEVYSKSFSAHHLFGDRLNEFDGRLRTLLAEHAMDGHYPTLPPDTDVRIWMNPPVRA
ncbi:class I SAM-dependent methyltransferase [Kitasatospora sp. NPDC056138]|uniref:class I SAM-dependent methyltransferase n=1 Tax=Kitasatospora sp. NPDC056138 TaxID=3345724 RepID=UPI0035D9EED3